MFAEAAAFLDAIFEQPADDTPRLVYADWLEEHGQANYAQFIRLQCAVAREKLWSPEANRLWEEIGRVWAGMSEAFWLGEGDWNPYSGRWNAGNLDAVHFHRGFLRHDSGAPFDLFVRRWSLWWPWFPAPVCLLTPVEGWAEQVSECPLLRRVRHLRFGVRRWTGSDDLAHLIAAPCLHQLRVLDAEWVTLSQAELETLLRPDTLPRLQELRLDFRAVEADYWQCGQRLPDYYRNARETQARLGEQYPRVTILEAE
jgi:uncharacterized protein (TIGR02996 family)